MYLRSAQSVTEDYKLSKLQHRTSQSACELQYFTFLLLKCFSVVLRNRTVSLQQNDEYVIRRWARFKNNVFYFKELAIK